jgi:hypothetical protein
LRVAKTRTLTPRRRATELEPSCTLVEMARLQGDGVLRRIEAPLVDRGL